MTFFNLKSYLWLVNNNIIIVISNACMSMHINIMQIYSGDSIYQDCTQGILL